MEAGTVLDIVIVVALVAALWTGLARGILHTLGAIVGLVVGGAAALVVMPLVSGWVPLEGWNVAAALASGVVLLAIGVSLGEAIARVIRRPVRKLRLGGVDRVLGGVGSVVVTLAVLLMLSMSVGSLGIPSITQAVASSSVLRAIEDVTPDPVQGALAQLRSVVMEDGIPTVLDAAGVPSDTEIPDDDTATPALQQAAQSVARITANAPSCGTASAGSGFVVADDRILTNAHVVAGASEIVVEAPGEIPRAATVVSFDPEADIAILTVDGLQAEPLGVAATPDAGTSVFFQGYPYGGPFVSRNAAIVSTGDMVVADIYGEGSVTRSITTIAGDVEPGNSGGPLLTSDGAVAGMIFARSDSRSDVGYALSMDEITSALASASALSAPVPTGACA